jgi:putative ABC transport system permease protein
MTDATFSERWRSEAPAAPQPTVRRSLAARFAIMSKTGLSMMFHDRLKLAGTLFGVIFAVVLANQQAGVFLGLMAKNTMFVANAGADAWIVPAFTETLQAGKPVSLSALYQARTTPGVAWAEPLLYGAAMVSLPDGGSEPVTLVGTSAPAWRGGPWNMVAGSADALRQPSTMIFEDSERAKLGGLNLGSVREVNGRRTVVGGFTWGLLPFAPSFAFAEYENARELLKMSSEQTSFILIGAQPGVSPAALRDAVQAKVPHQRVLTSSEFEDRVSSYVLAQTGMGFTFGTSTAFGLLVGLVIVSLSMFSAVVDNVREFGTLKALGSTNTDLAMLLLVQSAIYAVLGSLLGLAIVSRVAAGMRSPKLAMVLPWQMYVGTALLMVLLCAGASMLALLRLRKVEPAMVFR